MSTRPSTSTRPPNSSTATGPRAPVVAPRPPLTIDPTAHIADKASLTGTYPISIAASAVIHPFARLVSTRGPIDIGPGVMLWERAVVGGEVKVGNSDGAGETSEGAGDMRTVLERHVVVEAGAIVEAGARVGEGSVVEVGARVGSGCVLGEHCEITPLLTVVPGTQLPAYTVVFGNNQHRTNETFRDQPVVKGLYEQGHEKHLGMMRKIVKGGTSKWQ